MDEIIAKAAEEIDRIFAEKAAAIAAEQVRLALAAEDESVRAKTGDRIIEHIKGSPVQRIDQRIATAKIVSHMAVPGIAGNLPAPPPGLPAPSPDLSTAPGTRDINSVALSRPRSPRQFRAAISPAAVKSRFQLDKRLQTDPKNKGPLGVVPDSPEPSKV